MGKWKKGDLCNMKGENRRRLPFPQSPVPAADAAASLYTPSALLLLLLEIFYGILIVAFKFFKKADGSSFYSLLLLFFSLYLSSLLCYIDR